MTEYSIDEFLRMTGEDLGVSDWLLVDQAMIDRFAEATGDTQWIHVDAERAGGGPYGATVAHGFLTASLLPRLLSSVYRVRGMGLVINYGLDRLRFPAPVVCGSLLRVRATLIEAEPVGGMFKTAVAATMELRGSPKPACVATVLLRLVPEEAPTARADAVAVR